MRMWKAGRDEGIACGGASRSVADKARPMRYLGSGTPPRPGWRSWQTQQTQNLPALVVMGVRPPLPAPELNLPKINHLQNRQIVCAEFVPRMCRDCAKTSSFPYHNTRRFELGVLSLDGRIDTTSFPIDSVLELP